MEAPLHKACGTKHWSTQSCPLSGQMKPKTLLLSNASETTKQQPVSSHSSTRRPISYEKDTSTPNSSGLSSEFSKNESPTEVKPKYDRNSYHRSYMRDYMRRRRAAGKRIALMIGNLSDGRQAGTSETVIEITPAMIERGSRYLLQSGFLNDCDNESAVALLVRGVIRSVVSHSVRFVESPAPDTR